MTHFQLLYGKTIQSHLLTSRIESLYNQYMTRVA